MDRGPGKLHVYLATIVLGLFIVYVLRDFPQSVAGNSPGEGQTLVVTGFQSDSGLPVVKVKTQKGGEPVELRAEDLLKLRSLAREYTDEDVLELQLSQSIDAVESEGTLSNWISSRVTPSAGPLH